MYQYLLFGASQTGRKHVENQDRIVQRLLTDAAGQASGCLIAVVDGVSSSAFGASVARWLADEHLAKDPIADEPAIPLVAAIESYLAGLHREFVEEFEDLEPMFKSAASISLAVVRGAEAVSRPGSLGFRIRFVFPVVHPFPLVVSQYLIHVQLIPGPSQNRACAARAPGSPPAPAGSMPVACTPQICPKSGSVSGGPPGRHAYWLGCLPCTGITRPC